MPAFATDSTILLPGVGAVESPERKLLVLAAYGRLSHYAHFGRDELTNPSAPAGELGGRSTDLSIRKAEEGAALLCDRLPVGAPDDFQLVISLPILDEYEQMLRQGRAAGGLGLTDELAKLNRRIILNLVSNAPLFGAHQVTAYTGERSLDMLLETAIRGRADVVISDLPEIEKFVGLSQQYQAGEVAIRNFTTFQNDVGLTSLEPIDGRLLDFAWPYFDQ